MKLKYAKPVDGTRGRKPTFPELLQRVADLELDKPYLIKPPKDLVFKGAKVGDAEERARILRNRVAASISYQFSEQAARAGLSISVGLKGENIVILKSRLAKTAAAPAKKATKKAAKKTGKKVAAR